MSWDDPQYWIKLLTPKLTTPADNRIDKSPNTLNDALESLYPRRWSSEATPKVEVKPLGEDVINYLKEQRLPDSEESLYDYGIRTTKEENDLHNVDMPPEPILRFCTKFVNEITSSSGTRKSGLLGTISRKCGELTKTFFAGRSWWSCQSIESSSTKRNLNS